MTVPLVVGRLFENFDSSKLNMYADDTIISFSSNSICTINNSINDLMMLKPWLEENEFSLNVAKTRSQLIGSWCKIKSLERPDSSKLSLAIGDEQISLVVDTR